MSASAATGRKETEAIPDLYGRWVESAVGAHLLNISFSEQAQIFYWREGNMEVDFVLVKGKKTIGIEVKSGRSKGTKGMAEFSKRFAPDKILLVGKDGLTLREFFSLPLSELLT